MIPAVVVHVLAVIGAVTVFCAVVVAWIVATDSTPVTEPDEPADVSWGFTRDEVGEDR